MKRFYGCDANDVYDLEWFYLVDYKEADWEVIHGHMLTAYGMLGDISKWPQW